MSTKVEFEATVCGGFPVRVTANVQRAEPDVGIMDVFAEDIEVMTLRGKPADFIERKMTKDDWDDLDVAAREAYYQWKGRWC